MKNIWIFLWCGLLFIGCYDDENLHADYVDYGRVYDTTSADPVVKYVSQYYYKYRKVMLYDADTADYMFNFKSKNDVRIVQPSRAEAYLMKGFKFMEDVFLNGYNDRVKNEFFPYAIILGDSIYDINNKKYVNIYTASSYIAFVINDGILNSSEEEKETLSRDWNNTFLNYCINKTGWKVPEEFYLYPSDGEFKENWWFPYPDGTADTPGDLNPVWEKGYPWGMWDYSWEGWNKVYGYSLASSRAFYLEQFFKFLFTTPQETIDQAIRDHEKLRKAHDILDKALKEDFGIDYRTMIYKAKK